MKTLKAVILVLFISVLSVAKTFAQEPMEDVIYLKNGSVYRGMIIEQVPNVSMKIQTLGGNIFFVTIADVTKITKENKVQEGNNYNHFEPPFMHGWHKGDSTHNQFRPKRKGYFFNAQILVENLQGGVRIINGYKFNRFAYLGVGIGFDNVFNAPYVRSHQSISKSSYQGLYFPIYLYYAGDILNKRVTPYYALELGYTMGPKKGTNLMNGDGFDRNNMRGGAFGGLGLGIKVNTRRGGNLSVLFNMNVKQVKFTETNTFTDVFGTPYTTTEKKQALLFFPGIRFCLGF